MEFKSRWGTKAVSLFFGFIFLCVGMACGALRTVEQPTPESRPVETPPPKSNPPERQAQSERPAAPVSDMHPAAEQDEPPEIAKNLEQTSMAVMAQQMDMAKNLFTITMPKYQEPGGSSQPYPVQLEQTNPGQSLTEEPQPKAEASSNQRQPEDSGQVSRPNPPNAKQPGETGQVSKSNPTVVVAVFDVQDASKKNRVDQDTLDQLTEYLAAQLTEQVGFRVVPRNQLRERLAEQRNESYKKCYDESCQIELGKAVAAQKSLATKLLRVGNKCAITAILYDLKTETTEKATSADTDCNEDSLMEGVRTIARKLSGKDVNSR
jgi:hypothetical protein